MRQSILERIKISDNLNLDIVKSTHFIERDAERKINGMSKAHAMAKQVALRIYEAWQKRGTEKMDGFIRDAKGMNIVYAIEPSPFEPNSVDLVLQTIMHKPIFKKRKENFIIIANVEG